MKRGGIRISEELLKKKLDIPEKHKITGMKWEPSSCMLNIYTCGDDLREHEEGWETELEHRY